MTLRRLARPHQQGWAPAHPPAADTGAGCDHGDPPRARGIPTGSLWLLALLERKPREPARRPTLSGAGTAPCLTAHDTPPLPLLLTQFIAASLAAEAALIWLSRRHVRFVRRHRDEVPAPFRASVTLAEHRRAADYTVAEARFGILSGLFGLGVTLFWVCGGIDFAAGWIDRAMRPSAARDTVLVGAVAALSALATLPLGHGARWCWSSASGSTARRKLCSPLTG